MKKPMYTQKELEVILNVLSNMNVNMKEVAFFIALVEKTKKLMEEAV